jgi:rhodanese-related sulfurtransferase
VKSITVTELAALLMSDPTSENLPLVLDVREPWEVSCAQLLPSLHIPMGEITARFEEIDATRSIVCLCHHGVRSLQVARFLQSRGFTDVLNLSGGINAWSIEVDSRVPIY